MNMMRRIKSIASGRTSVSSDPVSISESPPLCFFFFSALEHEISKEIGLGLD